jgi:UDP-2,3-diacylglucosamine hydrolase
MPDWQAMLQAAPEIFLGAPDGYVYILADSHLGDQRAPVEEFVRTLERLPDARMLVFLGDLFKVWLAMPKFWDERVRQVLNAFQRLRAQGTPVLFVVGNREFFLPAEPEALAAAGLPFDHVVHGACVLRWGARRYGLTHGDVVNRKDRQYLKWRRLSRGRLFAGLFRLMPGEMARRIALRLERSLANTNLEIKIQYPADELRAFAASVLDGLDMFLIGHFHRDETIAVPQRRGVLRIVPDWFSRRAVLRLDPQGALEAFKI